MSWDAARGERTQPQVTERAEEWANKRSKGARKLLWALFPKTPDRLEVSLQRLRLHVKDEALTGNQPRRPRS